MTKVSQQPRMKLFSRFRPSFGWWVEDHPDAELDEDFFKAADVIKYGTIFDCRSLPLEFVVDSGEGWDWLANWLPYSECYFEFACGTGVVAWHESEVDISKPDLPPVVLTTIDEVATGNGLETLIRCPVFAGAAGCLDAKMADPIVKGNSRLPPTAVDGIPFSSDETTNPTQLKVLTRGAILLKGVICLLTEKLVLDNIVPDSVPHLNKARKKKGKPPLDAEHHVITLYVPGIKHAVSRHGSYQGGTHASPMLHWRRGHERVLSRGTPDELHTTVRRHLVGDPDKGFVKPSYRLLPRKGAV